VDNLTKAFPEKSAENIETLTRNYYNHLCDVILESIKGYTLSTNKLLKRYIFLNPIVVNQYFEKGQDVIIAMSHYCNWEWGSMAAGTVLKHKLVSLYKPLSNKYTDNYVRKLRKKQNMELVSIYDPKYIFRLQKNNPKAFFFISDQNPGNIKKVFWTKFLNQDTAWLRGIEDYAKVFNMPVVYVDIERVIRGYYTVQMQVLCNNPSETVPGEITERYIRKLESIVIKNPEDWLWSHRRWKLKMQ